MPVDDEREEKKLEKEFLDVFWYVVFLSIAESRSVLGINYMTYRAEIVSALQAEVEELASAAARSATAAWKARYSAVLSDTVRRNLPLDIAMRNLSDATKAMQGRIGAKVHDDIMNVFRATIARGAIMAGVSFERYQAMPGADEFCLPYHNNTYRFGEGPQPPIHFFCRCIRIPVVRP